MMICSECGKELAPGTNICPNCGAPVQTAAPEEKVCSECGCRLSSGDEICPQCGAPTGSTHPVFCRECGSRLSGSEAVCPNCGAPLNATPLPQQISPQTQPVPESGGLAVCAMVFALLCPPIGLILGIIGKKKYRIPTNTALCKAAVIISVITCIVYTIILVKAVPEVMDKKRTIDDATDKYKTIKDFFS